MEKAFLFPGRDENRLDSELRSHLKNKNFAVENVDIDWSKKLKKNIRSSSEYLENSEFGDKNIFIGFSWGSILALVNAPEHSVDQLVLCSLSPDFREDYENMSSLKRVLSRFLSTSLDQKPNYPQFDGKIFFLYGEREYHGVFGISSLGYGGKITKNRLERYSRSEERIIENAGHNINSNYREEIKKILDQI